MSNAPETDANFVASWLEKCQAAQPDSPIVQALMSATSDGQIDEARLVKDLRALTLVPKTESEK